MSLFRLFATRILASQYVSCRVIVAAGFPKLSECSLLNLSSQKENDTILILSRNAIASPVVKIMLLNKQIVVNNKHKRSILPAGG